ncbi:MAG: hypothetical protein RIS75_871 [Actinomycetota bacterium]|jgi:hypothetical protein
MLKLMNFVFEETPTPMRTDIPDPALVSPGTIGGLFFVGMAVAVYFLWRSMNGHLKKIDAPREEK